MNNTNRSKNNSNNNNDLDDYSTDNDEPVDQIDPITVLQDGIGTSSGR